MADAGWSIVQTPVAAGLAWYIAHNLLGHHQPFFAPTAAAVSLSKMTALRGQRALQLIVGVVIGIVSGTAVKAVAGSTQGAWGAVAIAVAVLVALVTALALGAGFFSQGVLFVNQSATSAILMITVAGAATSSERLYDALIGGGVTLVMTVVLFPAAPLPLVEHAVWQLFAELHGAVAELADTAGPVSPGRAFAVGQRVQHQVARLQDACSTARQVAGLSPRRWAELSQVRRAGDQTAPLELLAASVVSLAHVSMAGFVRPPPSPALRTALAELAAAFAALAEGSEAGTASAAAHAIRVRALTADAANPSDGSGSDLIASLIQTCADDTLQFTGQAGRVTDRRGSRAGRAASRRRWQTGRPGPRRRP